MPQHRSGYRKLLFGKVEKPLIEINFKEKKDIITS